MHDHRGDELALRAYRNEFQFINVQKQGSYMAVTWGTVGDAAHVESSTSRVGINVHS